jgi:hypothetical protein
MVRLGLRGSGAKRQPTSLFSTIPRRTFYVATVGPDQGVEKMTRRMLVKLSFSTRKGEVSEN